MQDRAPDLNGLTVCWWRKLCREAQPVLSQSAEATASSGRFSLWCWWFQVPSGLSLRTSLNSYTLSLNMSFLPLFLDFSVVPLKTVNFVLILFIPQTFFVSVIGIIPLRISFSKCTVPYMPISGNWKPPLKVEYILLAQVENERTRTF